MIVLPARVRPRAHRRGAVGVAVFAVALMNAAPGHAQTVQTTIDCAVTIELGADACAKGQDLFNFLAPQVGVALSAGNAMLGEGGALGGWGRRSMVVRVSAFDGRVPANTVPVSIGPAVSSDFGEQRAVIPIAAVDAAIGLFRGVPFGLTNIGGVDLLLGGTVVPNATRAPFTLRSGSGGFAAAVGVRVGLFQESALVPGVAFTYMRRRLPTLDIRYASGGDTIGVVNSRVRSGALRMTVNKRFGLVAVGGGVGRDALDTQVDLDAVVRETVAGVPVSARYAQSGLRDETTRTTGFVHVAFGLAATQVVIETGYSRAGDTRSAVNRFGDRVANEGYRYGSVGLGLRF